MSRERDDDGHVLTPPELKSPTASVVMYLVWLLESTCIDFVA